MGDDDFLSLDLGGELETTVTIIGSDGLIGLIKSDSISVTVKQGSMADVCSAVKIKIEDYPLAVPTVFIAAGSFNFRMNRGEWDLAPVNYLTRSWGTLQNNLVTSVMDSINDLRLFIEGKKGKLMVASIIPIAANMKLQPDKYREFLSFGFVKCNELIHKINKEMNGKSCYLSEKFEWKVKKADTVTGQKMVKKGLFEDNGVFLKKKGQIVCQQCCQHCINRL